MSAIFDSGNKFLTFIVKGTTYSINNDVVTAFLKLPENNCLSGPTPSDIVSVLNTIGYALETNNLGKIV